MIIIANSENNSIVSICSATERVQNGLLIHEVSGHECIIPDNLDVLIYEDIDVPHEIKIQKYCYTESDGFYKNENYVEYLTPEQRMDKLELEQAEGFIDHEFRLCTLEM